MGYQDVKFSEGSLFLVTGGAGFIGSNLCEAILGLGYKVRCLDNLSTGKKENVALFADNPDYTFIKGDVKDFDTCMKACNEVDFVMPLLLLYMAMNPICPSGRGEKAGYSRLMQSAKEQLKNGLYSTQGIMV